MMKHRIDVMIPEDELQAKVAELGRQPWIVYGVLKTSEGVSKAVTSPQVIGSLVGFTLIYSLLGAIDIYLLAKYARKGPDDDLSGIIKPTTVKGA